MLRRVETQRDRRDRRRCKRDNQRRDTAREKGAERGDGQRRARATALREFVPVEARDHRRRLARQIAEDRGRRAAGRPQRAWLARSASPLPSSACCTSGYSPWVRWSRRLPGGSAIAWLSTSTETSTTAFVGTRIGVEPETEDDNRTKLGANE